MEVTKDNLVNLGRQYQIIMGLPQEKVKVDFVEENRKDAIIRISGELVMAISTGDNGTIHLVLGEAVQTAKLLEHGVWIVISQDGTRFKANPIAHKNEVLMD